MRFPRTVTFSFRHSVVPHEKILLVFPGVCGFHELSFVSALAITIRGLNLTNGVARVPSQTRLLMCSRMTGSTERNDIVSAELEYPLYGKSWRLFPEPCEHARRIGVSENWFPLFSETSLARKCWSLIFAFSNLLS